MRGLRQTKSTTTRTQRFALYPSFASSRRGSLVQDEGEVRGTEAHFDGREAGPRRWRDIRLNSFVVTSTRVQCGLSCVSGSSRWAPDGAST